LIFCWFSDGFPCFSACGKPHSSIFQMPQMPKLNVHQIFFLKKSLKPHNPSIKPA
jgi:hypothetical protein